MMAAVPAPMAPPAPAPARGGAPATASTSSSPIPAASLHTPLVTYQGALDLRVRDAAATIDAVIAAAESVGGYLSARQDDAVEVRVPSPRFRETMSKLEPLGEVAHRTVSAFDVTDEFHDAEVRLTSLRATRARLQELLQKAGSLAETLEVERELERVAQEIDRVEGRLELLKSKVAFSSLRVHVEAKPKGEAVAVVKKDKRSVDLPVKWLDEMGTDRLLTLR
jgi:hypothetical protein